MAHTRHAHGPLVRALREAHGLPLTVCASRAKMSPGQLSKIERSLRVAPWEATQRLACVLDVDTLHLTGLLPAMRPLRLLVVGSDPQALADYAASLRLTVAELLDIELGVVAATPGQLELFARRLGVPVEVLTTPTLEETK